MRSGFFVSHNQRCRRPAADFAMSMTSARRYGKSILSLSASPMSLTNQEPGKPIQPGLVERGAFREGPKPGLPSPSHPVAESAPRNERRSRPCGHRSAREADPRSRIVGGTASS